MAKVICVIESPILNLEREKGKCSDVIVVKNYCCFVQGAVHKTMKDEPTRGGNSAVFFPILTSLDEAVL
jgi:hypothetical protein